MWEVYKGVERCDTCQYVESLFDSHRGSVSLRNSYFRHFYEGWDKY